MIIGFDAGARDLSEVEHVAGIVRDVLDPHVLSTAVVSTHVAQGSAAGLVCAATLDDGSVALAGGPQVVWAGLRAAVPAGFSLVATWPGAEDALVAGLVPVGAWSALAAAADRSSGRLVHYPGRSAMTGRFAVAEIEARLPGAEVRVVGASGPPAPQTRVDTRDFVRPIWERGTVVLLLQPGPNDTLIPFETENPHQCCGGH